MKKILLFFLLLVLQGTVLRAQIDPDVKPAATDPKPLKIGEFISFTADNHMNVFLIRREGYPMFRISIQLGIPLIPAETQPEVKKVLGTIFSMGNGMYTQEEINARADFYAAHVSGSTNVVTCAGMKCHLDTLFPMAAAFLTHPGIKPVPVKEAVEKALKQFADSAKKKPKTTSESFIGKLQDSLKFCWDSHPEPVKEQYEIYKKITPSGVNNYFSTYINPDNSYCIITGDFTREEINRLFSKYLKKWKGGVKDTSSYKPVYNRNYPSSRKIYVVDKPGAVQSRISVRWPLGDAYPYGDNEPLLMVMNQIYGAGYNSNLNRNIRLDKGLSYGANNILSVNATGGECTSRTLVRNRETAYALENIFFEMERMRNELVSPESLGMAKNGLLGDYAQSVSKLNSPAIIGFGMMKEKYNLPDDYLAKYPLRVAAITREDIRNAARKYIKPYECLVFIEGKVDDIRGTLEIFGPVVYFSDKGKRID